MIGPRLLKVGVVFGLLLLALIMRLAWMQVLQYDYWRSEAERSRTEKKAIPFKRGTIYDRDGRVLAEDSPSQDLHLVYRDFRRGSPYRGIPGHVAAQLLEAGHLLPAGVRDAVWRKARMPRDGLPECLGRAETLGGCLLALAPSDLSALPSKARADLRFYLRGLFGLPFTSLEDWMAAGSGPLAGLDAGAEGFFLARVDAARAAFSRLENILGAGAGELLQRVENERLRIEWRLRRQAARVAAGTPYQISGAQVLECLDDGVEAPDGWLEGPRLLAELFERWRLEGIGLDPARFESLLRHGAPEPPAASADSAPARAAGADLDERIRQLGYLLRQIESAAPKDVAGARRPLVLQLQDQPRRLISHIPWAAVDLLAQNPEHYPGLEAADKFRRKYRSDAPIALLGRAAERALSEEAREAQRAERLEYDNLRRKLHRSHAEERRFQELRRRVRQEHTRAGELAGVSGLERMLEPVLRGRRGYLDLLHRDGTQAGLRDLDFEPARNGQPVVLTLDLDLQHAAERAIEDGYRDAREALRNDPDPLRRALIPRLERPKAGFVLLDLRDGSVPVLATMPTYTDEDLRRGWERLEQDPAHPTAQRALGFLYHSQMETPYPGSTFKLVLAWAALRDDPAAWSRRFPCHGSYEGLKCEGMHGEPDLFTAIQHSCNAYFYQLGEYLGYAEVFQAARDLGFGAPTGILGGSLEPPAEKLLPHPPDRRSVRYAANHRWEVDAVRQMAIGQSEVVASPLQMARLYGWLATGVLWKPRLVARIGEDVQPAVRAPAPDLDPAIGRLLREALLAVVAAPGGTAYGSGLDAFGVAGKTGTAQVKGSGHRGPSTVHAWFTGFLPEEQPRWAFAVYCENAGLHGGEIATAVLRHFLMSEEFAPDLALER